MPECSRREFSARVAASVSATLVTAAAVANDMPPKPTPADSPAKEAPVAPPPPSREDHLLAALLDLYPGAHLTPEIVEGIRSGLMHNRRLAERIRATPLPFDTEPAFQFHVFRGN
jgi:hypothetical protein